MRSCRGKEHWSTILLNFIQERLEMYVSKCVTICSFFLLFSLRETHIWNVNFQQSTLKFHPSFKQHLFYLQCVLRVFQCVYWLISMDCEWHGLRVLCVTQTRKSQSVRFLRYEKKINCRFMLKCKTLCIMCIINFCPSLHFSAWCDMMWL